MVLGPCGLPHGTLQLSGALALAGVEPSLGLAPLVTRELFDILERASREDGLALLIVEQNANLALAIADRAYVLETGRIVAQGTGAELLANDTIKQAYLGVG